MRYTTEYCQTLGKKLGIELRSKSATQGGQKLLWRCTKCHYQWRATPYKVKDYRIGCKRCAIKAQQLTINIVKKRISDRGYKLLSNKYKRASERLTVKCPIGHNWRVTLSNFRKRNCPQCAGFRRISIATLRSAAHKRKGRCISVEYLGYHRKHRWSCSNRHTWSASAGSVLNGSWCNICAGKKKYSLHEARDICVSNGYKLLSKEYRGANKPIEIRCKSGHRTRKTLSSILKGTGCRHCSAVSRGLNKRFPIKTISKLVEARGGKFPGIIYSDEGAKLTLACAFGHKWQTSLDSFRAGSWCKECNSRIGERIARFFFEQCFDSEFPTKRPTWLRSTSGYPLELDGYSKSLRIAFEHQGQQHYRPGFGTTPTEHLKLLARDKLKVRICRKKSVRLIVIPQIPELLPIEKLGAFLAKEFRRHRLRPKIDPKKVKPNLIELSTSREHRLTSKIDSALSKIGLKRTEQLINNRTKFSVECYSGHTFTAHPENVLRGRTPCRLCAKNQKIDSILSIHKLKRLSEYSDRSCRIQLRCSSGHSFSLTYATLINQRGKYAVCRKCSSRKK